MRDALLNLHAKIPQDVKGVLDQIVDEVRKILGEQLIGVYLHGSVAIGTFNPVSSDIDLLIVSKDAVPSEHKRAIQKLLLELSPKAPGKGVEISILTLASLKNLSYPTPYEFHFGSDHMSKYMTGFIDEGATDPDLAAHFVIVRERGICLYGESIANVFPQIPAEYYLQSIAHDSEWSYGQISRGTREGVGPVPVYAVLNFCRVLAFIKAGLITSKIEGGEWGIKSLPREFHPLINEALNEYRQSGTSASVDLQLLQRFADYSIEIIRNA